VAIIGHQNPVELKTVIHQGNLYYRIPSSGKRISYRTLKKGLEPEILFQNKVKTNFLITSGSMK